MPRLAICRALRILRRRCCRVRLEPLERAVRGCFAMRRCSGLEFLLDEAFRIPGTNFRFGMDGIIGLVPGLGDVLAGLLSLIIPLAAWMRGVPYVTLLRMAANLGIGVLVGSIPGARRPVRCGVEGEPAQLRAAAPSSWPAAPPHLARLGISARAGFVSGRNLCHSAAAGGVAAGVAAAALSVRVRAALSGLRGNGSAIQSSQPSGRSAVW